MGPAGVHSGLVGLVGLGTVGDGPCYKGSSREARTEFARCRARIRDALERLAATGSAASIRASGPRELVDACGFTRAMLSGVRGSRWIPLQFHTRDELDPKAGEFRRYVAGRQEIALANLLVETEMARRRAPLLVDPSLLGSRAFRPIVEASGSSAYVAAPIVVEGTTIGFMHADRVGQPRPVDADDLRYIRAFSAGLAVAYQRAVWNERIGERAERVGSEMDRCAASLRQLVHRPPALATATVGAQTNGLDEGPDLRTGWASLTARETEVLSHVADGATNQVIAQRLSLSEETVKSHVRKVLRKLRVTTRGAAVARYLGTGASQG